jgi:hypothetical protein
MLRRSGNPMMMDGLRTGISDVANLQFARRQADVHLVRSFVWGQRDPGGVWTLAPLHATLLSDRARRVAVREPVAAVERAAGGVARGRGRVADVGGEAAVVVRVVHRDVAVQVVAVVAAAERGVARRARAALLVRGDAGANGERARAEAHARLAGREQEALVRDLAERVDVVRAEDRLGEEVEDAVEDHLLERRDDVAAVGDAPADGVEQPDDREEGSWARCQYEVTAQLHSVALTGAEIRLVDVIAERGRASAGLDEKHPPNVDEGCAAECEVAPLVARRGERADQASNDHDQVHEDDHEDLRERQAGVEEQLEEEERGRNRPVDVAGVLQPLVSTCRCSQSCKELAQMERVTPGAAPRGYSARTATEPRSEAMEKYAMLAVVRMRTGSWWNRRVPRGRCRGDTCEQRPKRT